MTTDAENEPAAQEPEAESQEPKKPQAKPPARAARTARPAAAARAPGARGRGASTAEAPEAQAPDASEAEAQGAAPSKCVRGKVEHRPPARLLARYRDEVRGQLINEFGYTSSMRAPQVTKVVLNIGLGEALTNARALEVAPEHLAVISGQKPVITKARISVAGFKVREGQAIGVMVTLRGRRMYEFLDRLISTALPRIRDFRGVPRASFDGSGNFSLGLREQVVFPEIDYGSIDRVRGLQVSIVTTARTDPEGFRLLELMGMPFAHPEAA